MKRRAASDRRCDRRPDFPLCRPHPTHHGAQSVAINNNVGRSKEETLRMLQAGQHRVNAA